MSRYARSYDGERRTELLGVKLTPTERAELDAAARQQGACTSTYARELLFRRSAAVIAGTRRNPDAAEIARELSAIGNNLNQITRHMHVSGELDPFGDLHELLKAALSRVISA